MEPEVQGNGLRNEPLDESLKEFALSLCTGISGCSSEEGETKPALARLHDVFTAPDSTADDTTRSRANHVDSAKRSLAKQRGAVVKKKKQGKNVLAVACTVKGINKRQS